MELKNKYVIDKEDNKRKKVLSTIEEENKIKKVVVKDENGNIKTKKINEVLIPINEG